MPRHIEIIRLLEIEANAALAPVPGGVRRGIPNRAAWGIDVNDVGTLVGQQHGGEGASDVLAKVNHANTCQCTGHVFSPVATLASAGHQTTSQAASSRR